MSTTTTSITLSHLQGTHGSDPSSTCPKCGAELSLLRLQSSQEAQARIEELESQVKILTLRATSAVERATEYETSLRRLTASTRTPPNPVQTTFPAPTNRSSLPNSNTSDYPSLPTTALTNYTPTSATNPPPQQSPPRQPPNSRLTRLLPTRSASTASTSLPSSAPLNRAATPSTPHNPTTYPATAGLAPSELSLLDALTHEQTLRRAAESAAAQTNSEIEELTGQLFEQANEMVASERKARARLEERVEVLERRDGEKAKRLGLLERRVERVERVRGLLEREKEIERKGAEDEKDKEGDGKEGGSQEENNGQVVA